MSMTFIELIEIHKKTVSMCDIAEAARRIAEETDLVIIDVREPAEFEAESIPSAVNIPRGFLEFRIAEACGSTDHPILIHCKTGGRAVLAGRTLSEMGYSNVGVVGGKIEDLIAAVGSRRAARAGTGATAQRAGKIENKEEIIVARIAAEGPNAQQIEYWNEVSGARWVEMDEVIDAQIAPLGEVGIERAAPESGERVLDVGCGCGQTSLQLAERVGTEGKVVGVDISAVMLEHARERAAQADRSNLEFRNADAQTEPFADHFDLLFSRFGVMFFASPKEAFSNLRAALRPGGRLTFVTWQALAANPWMQVPLAAAAKHLPPGGPPPDPTAPGPYAFADSVRVEGLLTGAGFENVKHESIERELIVGGGGTLDDTVAFVLQLGPVGAALREADDELRARVFADVRAAVEPFYDGSGARMPASCWVVSANRPD